MTLGTIMLLVLGMSICFCYWLARRITRLDYNAKHFQWLWNNGLQESAYIVGPDTFDWIGF